MKLEINKYKKTEVLQYIFSNIMDKVMRMEKFKDVLKLK